MASGIAEEVSDPGVRIRVDFNRIRIRPSRKNWIRVRPTRKKYPNPDPILEINPDPDTSLENNLDPDHNPTRTPGSGSE